MVTLKLILSNRAVTVVLVTAILESITKLKSTQFWTSPSNPHVRYLENQALGEVDELPGEGHKCKLTHIVILSNIAVTNFTVIALLDSINLRIFNVIMEGHIQIIFS